MRVLLAGSGEHATQLAEALMMAGVDALVAPDGDLPAAMTGAESALASGSFDGAVAVGTGESSLALAITAAKLGVPLAACLGEEADAESSEGAEQRILGTLAAESFPLGAGAPGRLVAWLNAGS